MYICQNECVGRYFSRGSFPIHFSYNFMVIFFQTVFSHNKCNDLSKSSVSLFFCIFFSLDIQKLNLLILFSYILFFPFHFKDFIPLEDRENCMIQKCIT